MAKRPANIYRIAINTHYKEVICIVSTKIKVVNTNFFFLQNLLCRNRCLPTQDNTEADTVTPNL